MLTVLALGLLVGLRHALEADHIAAVTSLASGSGSLLERVKVAAIWGSGHAAALMILGGALVALGTALPEPVARGLEIAAGGMLIALGVDVLRRLRARRVHVHVHQHGDGVRHLHAHAHDATPHRAPVAHDHRHVRTLLPRALAVGGIHGLAGSGALVVLSMQTLGSGMLAVAYVACFAVGSILGMVAFSLMLTLPFALSPRLLELTAGRLEAAVGVVTISIGCWMALQAAAF
ncbi:MAG TPA: urease accessory protein [Candidatus Dormibacteraeota bacterium]|nr:urease accessory protein [Candidatus Dormibacteraeota bacterium]